MEDLTVNVNLEIQLKNKFKFLLNNIINLSKY